MAMGWWVVEFTRKMDGAREERRQGALATGGWDGLDWEIKQWRIAQKARASAVLVPSLRREALDIGRAVRSVIMVWKLGTQGGLG